MAAVGAQMLVDGDHSNPQYVHSEVDDQESKVFNWSMVVIDGHGTIEVYRSHPSPSWLCVMSDRVAMQQPGVDQSDAP